MSFLLLHMCEKYKALHKFCGSLWRYMRGGTGKGEKERVGKRLGSVLLYATQSQLKRFKNFPLTLNLQLGKTALVNPIYLIKGKVI